MPGLWWSLREDATQASGAEIRMEAHAGGHRITYVLGVMRRDAPLRERARLVLRCYEDGTVTAAWSRAQNGDPR